MLSLVKAILRMLWEYSHVSPKVDAPTDSLTSRVHSRRRPVGRGRAQGLGRSPVLRPELAARGSDTVEGQALRSVLGLPGPPTSLFEMKTSPAPLVGLVVLSTSFWAA